MVPITVGDLVEMPQLQLGLLHGEAGLARPVTWTHTSDLPGMWQWVTGGELVMTNGMSMPADGPGQADLVERLDAAGACGLAIGADMYAPPLTGELADASERLAFPILSIPFPMPFVGISRAVAEANLLDQSARVSRTARIYDAVRRTASRSGSRLRLLEHLEPVLGCELYLCDRTNGRVAVPGGRRPGASLAAAVVRCGEQRRVTAGAFGVDLPDGRSLLCLDLLTGSDVQLVVVSDAARTFDTVLVQHVTTVASLELSHAQLQAEHDRATAADLLTQLLDGRIDDAAAQERMAATAGIDAAGAVLVSTSGEHAAGRRPVHAGLWREEVPHLLCRWRGGCHLLVADHDDLVARLTDLLDPGSRFGVSGPVGEWSRVPEAAQEAGWSLSACQRNEQRATRYGELAPWRGLGGIADGQAAVHATVGPLVAYDEAHGTALVETLRAFLETRRSWQRTAERLHLHKQTVVYRIRRVEELTGRDLRETQDIAELWWGLQAAESLRIGHW